MPDKPRVFVATAYRLSNRENHSYVIGAFSTLEKAKIAAREHSTDRGFKYGYGIDECPIDEEVEDQEENIVDGHDGKAWRADAP